MKDLRTPLAKVKGLGSAKSGLHHWWMQRLTAIALIPLTLWFCFAVAALPEANYETVREWIGSTFNATMLTLFVVVGFYHAQLGLQVIIEDYVSCHTKRTAAIIAVNFACVFFAVAGVFSILKIALGA